MGNTQILESFFRDPENSSFPQSVTTGETSSWALQAVNYFIFQTFLLIHLVSTLISSHLVQSNRLLTDHSLPFLWQPRAISGPHCPSVMFPHGSHLTCSASSYQSVGLLTSHLFITYWGDEKPGSAFKKLAIEWGNRHTLLIPRIKMAKLSCNQNLVCKRSNKFYLLEGCGSHGSPHRRQRKDQVV